ncbi:two-component system regulatory protein YycI [Camelliibacillus cellulosilyticus]|uniref:Two-component system regulatory protein YycI n=1 Tax=Camelliibacillus cellulosilyticus TaxID=2174486 RepID=A0ABV9GN86_9BACL
MNWGKTKTIFIICFLLLDVFLSYQLYERQMNNEKQLGETGTSEVVNLGNIPQPTAPTVDQDVYTLNGSYLNFEKDDDAKEKLKAIVGTKKSSNISLQTDAGGMVLHASFKKPIDVPANKNERQDFLAAYVYNGQDYKYWSFDKTKGVMRFIQQFKGNTVFSVDNGHLNTLDLTVKNGKITGYVQTYFDAEQEEKVKISIKYEEALKSLFDNNLLFTSEVKEIEDGELGYFNITSNSDANSRLLYVPAWYIKVKSDSGEKEFFIKVDTGQVIQPTSNDDTDGGE